MRHSKTNILTCVLAVCGLTASATFIYQYQRSPQLDEIAMWYEQYGGAVDLAGKSVVALEIQMPSDIKNMIVQNLGSGFIIDPAGYIVTNEHVVHNSERIYVTLSDKRKFIGRVISADQAADIAVLKIEADNLTPIQFGSAKRLSPGQAVIAMGNPLGTGSDGIAVATFGYINRLDQTLTSDDATKTHRFYDNLIQTSAITLPGNSGGPLINSIGQAIGIITAVAGDPSRQQFGFAIVLNDKILDTIEQLKQGRTLSHPFLGLALAPQIDQATQNRLGLKEISGALVISVIQGRPAQLAGIRPGDLVRAVDNQRIFSRDDLISRINGCKPNQLIQIELLRGSGGSCDKVSVTVKLIANLYSAPHKNINRSPQEKLYRQPQNTAPLTNYHRLYI